MRKALQVLGVSAGAAALVLSGAGAASAGGVSGSSTSYGAYTCAGGEIGSGHYARIKVTGACSVAADAVIKVAGDVRVAQGAVFDAQSAPSTIIVGGDVTARAGSLLGLGCQPAALVGNSAHPCAVEPDGHSTITVKGSVTATKADTVLLNGVAVRKSVTLTGGGGDIPWSIKNNTIHGSITASGQAPEWLGVMFNWVGGNVTLTNITLHDPDPGAPGVYVVRNTIRRNLSCSGLVPGVSGGFIPGEVNVVGRHATGQCASLV